jgi:hypothetical protein
MHPVQTVESRLNQRFLLDRTGGPRDHCCNQIRPIGMKIAINIMIQCSFAIRPLTELCRRQHPEKQNGFMTETAAAAAISSLFVYWTLGPHVIVGQTPLLALLFEMDR